MQFVDLSHKKTPPSYSKTWAGTKQNCSESCFKQIFGNCSPCAPYGAGLDWAEMDWYGFYAPQGAVKYDMAMKMITMMIGMGATG